MKSCIVVSRTEQLKTFIFMGPTYYQKLKHMSCDKIYSRSGGPVVSMTRRNLQKVGPVTEAFGLEKWNEIV